MVKISMPDIKKLKFLAICFNGTDGNALVNSWIVSIISSFFISSFNDALYNFL